MSDIDQAHIGATNPIIHGETEPGQLYIAEKLSVAVPSSPVTALASAQVQPAMSHPFQGQERVGTIEHLAARRPMPALDASIPEIKQLLVTRSAEWTRLVTGLRWEGQSVQEIATRMIPLLNVGPIEQWKTVLIPFLYEIDRGGALIPAWLNIIERGDPPDLAPDANPAETMEGRARRFAILMLGNYKMMGISGLGQTSRFAKSSRDESTRGAREVAEILGDLAIDPQTSLYATQSLVKHATLSAIQALIGALTHAKGWAKVDIINACLDLKQDHFYDLLIASGIDDAPGLESYIAIPIYCIIPLENYLSDTDNTNSRLQEQSALIFNQVLQDNLTSVVTTTQTDAIPSVFKRHLPTLAQALFTAAQRHRRWPHTLALHHLALLLGRYWGEISQGKISDGRIIDQIYQCMPMMNELEPWMQGPGREILLNTLTNPDKEALTPIVKVLGELREPRVASLLITRLDAITQLQDRSQALMVATMCETLAQLGEPRALSSLQHLANRVIDTPSRMHEPKLKDNLPPGDPDIPDSIVYAAVISACSRLGDHTALEMLASATRDFDPYVRSQALDAIRYLDPRGEDMRSRMAAREALHDPRESIVHSAIQLVIHYQDSEAVPLLRQLSETRPELANLAQATLRQLGQ